MVKTLLAVGWIAWWLPLPFLGYGFLAAYVAGGGLSACLAVFAAVVGVRFLVERNFQRVIGEVFRLDQRRLDDLAILPEGARILSKDIATECRHVASNLVLILALAQGVLLGLLLSGKTRMVFAGDPELGAAIILSPVVLALPMRRFLVAEIVELTIHSLRRDWDAERARLANWRYNLGGAVAFLALIGVLGIMWDSGRWTESLLIPASGAVALAIVIISFGEHAQLETELVCAVEEFLDRRRG